MSPCTLGCLEAYFTVEVQAGTGISGSTCVHNLGLAYLALWRRNRCTYLFLKSGPTLRCQQWLLCVGSCRRGSRQRKPNSNSMGNVTSQAFPSYCCPSPAHSFRYWRPDRSGFRKGLYGDFCFAGLDGLVLDCGCK